MNTRAKFSYMAFGGALVFLGMLGAMMSPLTAEKDKFGEIECTKLTIVNEEGQTLVGLGAIDQGGVIRLFAKGGRPVASIDVNKHGGGMVSVYGEGNYGAALLADETGGIVSVVGKDGKAGLTLDVYEHGGKVTVIGNSGQPLAMFGADEHGGEILMYGKGEEVLSDGKVDHGGLSVIRGNAGQPLTMLGVDEHGGWVSVVGQDLQGGAMLRVDENKTGVLNRWDKNGYRQ